MRVGVMGINHKLADIRVREAIAKACHKYFNSDKITHANHSFVLLSTCNRTEVYFSSPDTSVTHSYIFHLLREEIEEEFEQKIYSFFGYDCFYHLARVAAGLDSAILGETEIQGQVRLCYENALKKQKLPSELHFIFQKSLQIAKHARTRYLGNFSNASLEHAMWQICCDHTIENPRVLFVGASQTNQKNIWYFQKRRHANLWICNRTNEKAYTIAADLGIGFMPWEMLAHWRQFDIVCCATKSPEPLITELDNAATRLFFDLSVPRNIVSSTSAQNLYDIDQLQKLVRYRQTHLETSANNAEEYIAKATLSHISARMKREAVKIQLAYA